VIAVAVTVAVAMALVPLASLAVFIVATHSLGIRMTVLGVGLATTAGAIRGGGGTGDSGAENDGGGGGE
jgi:hypothetical protein